MELASAIPLPLYLLVLAPYAGLFYMRRYKPHVPLSPPGWERFEFGCCTVFAAIIFISLLTIAAFRSMGAFFG